MNDRETMQPPSSRDVAGDDFLFHLYRGSELLLDDKVHDAKAELEQALAMQPKDPKGQDLLGIVYFRLGLYPRAISIYERLVQSHPDAITPRVNLALCYLKTGQSAHARAELEQVLERDPNHARAWGYLGLAFQRLGDVDRASQAFTSGGHDAMARRLLEVATTTPSASLRPAAFPAERIEVQMPPEGVPREGAPRSLRSLISLGAEADAARHDSVPPLRSALREAPTQLPGPPTLAPPSTRVPLSQPISSVGPGVLVTPPADPAALARDLLIVFPRDLPVALHGSGVVLVQTSTSFAARLGAVRSMAFTASFLATPLPRRARGRALDEPLGGPESPLFEIAGRGDLVLGAPEGHSLRPLALEYEPLYMREDAVIGFDAGLAYENGRLSAGDGEAIPMLQIRGVGAVVVALPASAASIEVTPDRSVIVRAHAVLGWVGRVVPHALPPSEAPAGAHGLVSFAGEGMVLLDVR